MKLQGKYCKATVSILLACLMLFSLPGGAFAAALAKTDVTGTPADRAQEGTPAPTPAQQAQPLAETQLPDGSATPAAATPDASATPAVSVEPAESATPMDPEPTPSVEPVPQLIEFGLAAPLDAPQAGTFYFVVEADSALLIQPMTVRYDAGQSIGDALAALSGHSFVGLDTSFVTSVDGVAGNYMRASDSTVSGAVDLLSNPASNIGNCVLRFCKTEGELAVSASLACLVKAIVAYQNSTPAQRYAVAQAAYTAAVNGYIGATVGLGHLIGATTVPVYSGEPASYAVLRLLSDCGYRYNYSGTPDGGLYLKHVIQGSLVASYAIPEDLQAKINEDGLTWTGLYHVDSLGEHDFCQGAGWMYSVNGSYPNYSLSECYLKDGDVLRLRFTLAYGKDIGAGGTGYGVLPGYGKQW